MDRTCHRVCNARFLPNFSFEYCCHLSCRFLPTNSAGSKGCSFGAKRCYWSGLGAVGV
jgi:hypothetical protein